MLRQKANKINHNCRTYRYKIKRPDIHASSDPHEEYWLSVEDPPAHKYKKVMCLEMATSTCRVIERSTRNLYLLFWSIATIIIKRTIGI